MGIKAGGSFLTRNYKTSRSATVYINIAHFCLVDGIFLVMFILLSKKKQAKFSRYIITHTLEKNCKGTPFKRYIAKPIEQISKFAETVAKTNNKL